MIAFLYVIRPPSPEDASFTSQTCFHKDALMHITGYPFPGNTFLTPWALLSMKSRPHTETGMLRQQNQTNRDEAVCLV